jgi:hypothetical protein
MKSSSFAGSCISAFGSMGSRGCFFEIRLDTIKTIDKVHKNARFGDECLYYPSVRMSICKVGNRK